MNTKKFIEKIKKNANYYTPELKINQQNTNAIFGVSYALADMFGDTYKKFDELDEIYKIELAKILDVKYHEGFASSGIVKIDIKKEFDKQIHISKGTQLYTFSEDGSVVYNADLSIDIKHNQISNIVFCDSSTDNTQILYDLNSDEVDFKDLKITFFDPNTKVNPRKIYFICDELFEYGLIYNFDIKILSSQLDDWMDVLIDKRTKWMFTIGDYKCELIPKLKENTLYFSLKNSQIDEINLYLEDEKCEQNPFISVEIYDLKQYHSLSYQRVLMGAKGEFEPQKLVANYLDIYQKNSYMFGDIFSVYDEFYIGSSKVFSKRGALATISLHLDYIEVEKEEFIQMDNVKYRPFMHESDFSKKELSDIEIVEVVWEYYNGMSWKRILVGEENERFFVKRMKKIDIQFIIPEDIESTYVNADEMHYIRCKITKVSNYLKLSGKFISPSIIDVKLKFDYEGSFDNKYDSAEFAGTKMYFDADNIIMSKSFESQKRIPDLRLIDSGRKIDYEGSNDSLVFQRVRDAGSSIYIGFTKPLALGINTIYFESKDFYPNAEKIEYKILYSNANDQFTPIKVLDNTDNLSKSGMVMLFVEDNMHLFNMFGVDAYWIQISRNSMREDMNPIHLKNIALNVLPIVQKELIGPINFKNYELELHKIIELPDKSVSDLVVYVNEKDMLTTFEYENLKNDGNLYEELDLNAEVKFIWVKWQQVDKLSAANSEDRVYELDSRNGRIIFGDNKNGKILPIQVDDVLRVSYKIFTGEKGNVSKDSDFKFNIPIPEIEKMTSLVDTQWGMSAETQPCAVNRAMISLYHKNRVISIKDIEYMIKSGVAHVHDAKCIKRKFNLELIILPVDYVYDDFHFSMVHQKVFETLRKYADIELLNINIKCAKQLFISTKIKIAVNDVFEVPNKTFELNEYLDNYIKYTSEDGDRRTIGDVPTHDDIYNKLSLELGLEVDNLIVEYYLRRDDDYVNIDISDKSDLRYYVPDSLTHNISIREDR